MSKARICTTCMVIGLFVLFGVTTGFAAKGGIATSTNGIPLYVITEVTWDGVSPTGNWTLWGPKWAPVVGGEFLTGCTDCLDMNYTFTFHGKTVQFDEPMVDTVRATPQSRHVVLYDNDGDGTYTGSLSEWHYLPWASEKDGTWALLYFDRVDYEITFDEDGHVVYFHYLEYEHKKLK